MYVLNITTLTRLTHHLPSDTLQSESDTDIEGGLDALEYTLSQEEAPLLSILLEQ